MQNVTRRRLQVGAILHQVGLNSKRRTAIEPVDVKKVSRIEKSAGLAHENDGRHRMPVEHPELFAEVGGFSSLAKVGYGQLGILYSLTGTKHAIAGGADGDESDVDVGGRFGFFQAE